MRLELMETDTDILGVLSTRGYNKGAVYGCDYIVAGRINGNRLNLIRKNVQRAVAMGKEDCVFFQSIELAFGGKDSALTATAKWFWADGENELFTITKTDSVVSESAKDEMDGYFQDLYNAIAEKGILLAPEDRLLQKAGELQVDSTELLIDIVAVEKDIHDSITVMLNGEPIAEKFSLYKKPLRIRLQQIQKGISDIIIISESQQKDKLKLQITIKQQAVEKVFTAEPGFVRNIIFLLVHKQE